MPSHNLRVTDELWAAIERERGSVPRNRWICDRLMASTGVSPAAAEVGGANVRSSMSAKAGVKPIRQRG